MSRDQASQKEVRQHRLTVGQVPVDGFWSISLYNAEGYFQNNDRHAYSLNNLTARSSIARVRKSWTAAGSSPTRSRSSDRYFFFGWNASLTCFLMSPKFFPMNCSSSFVRMRNGTRTTLFSNFTLSQCWP